MNGFPANVPRDDVRGGEDGGGYHGEEPRLGDRLDRGFR